MGDDVRRAEDVEREYDGDGITVRWEPKLCIHAANCLRSLPGVFRSSERPWIVLEGADVEDVAAAVVSCPTGALSFRRNDEGPDEDVPETVEVRLQRNGPMYVRGRVTIYDERGEVIKEVTRAALCRCGHSENKPFCDDSHSRMGWRSVPPKPKTVRRVLPMREAGTPP